MFFLWLFCGTPRYVPCVPFYSSFMFFIKSPRVKAPSHSGLASWKNKTAVILTGFIFPALAGRWSKIDLTSFWTVFISSSNSRFCLSRLFRWDVSLSEMTIIWRQFGVIFQFSMIVLRSLRMDVLWSIQTTAFRFHLFRHLSRHLSRHFLAGYFYRLLKIAV